MKDTKMQNNGTSQAQDRSLSRRNLLLAGTALTAVAAVAAVEMAAAQQKPAAAAQKKPAAPAQPKPAAQPAPAPSGQKPNILVIMGDDIGLTNISAYSMGLMGYRTPNIDRIAKEGMIFTDYYAEQSCTAGRSSFITGQATLRTGLSKVGCLAPRWGCRRETRRLQSF